MTVLIDTSIWSLAFRRKRRDLSDAEKSLVHAARELVIAGDAAIISIIRQEVLSGIANPSQFQLIRDQLSAITTFPTSDDVCILAAEFFNVCKTAGVGPGHIDMTICAAAHTHNLKIFSADPDFSRYAAVLPIQLHNP